MRRPSSHCQCPVFASNFRPIGGCPPGGRVPQKMTRMAQRPPPQRGVRSSPLPIQCRARCAVDVNCHGCESARVQQLSQHQNVRRCQHWVMFFGKPRPAAGRSARSAKVSSSRARPAAKGRQRQFVAVGCSRSAPRLSRPSAGLRERLLSPSRICPAAPAKVKFQSRPVVH